jgi:hypothetical protein
MHFEVKLPPVEVRDSGKVRIGTMSPSFPAVRPTPTDVSDTGKVRIGTMSPSFPTVRPTPANVADTGKVRASRSGDTKWRWARPSPSATMAIRQPARGEASRCGC